jgi:hypothetical protein
MSFLLFSQGYVYGRPEGAEITYCKSMTVQDYLDMMLANDAVRELILKHLTQLERLLSRHGCTVVEQISDFDLDVIEVSNGYAFRISARAFFRYRKEDFRGKSARAFVPYDCLSPPNPDLFAEGINNSFPLLEERVNVLNKFYQCLVACRMPQKIRKLVFVGPKDSGKTSWAAIFHRIIPADKIVSVTSEGQFSASMIREDTQLIAIDEWSSMAPALAKTLLQGGWMVGAVKHKEPRSFYNNSPFYITTNQLPNFGEENENVYRRTQVFRTRALPVPTPGADQWIFDHAMDCIAWMANVITENIQLIEQEERWYEDTSGNNY